MVGRDPAGVWAAPGRVNLIGEHTDYNDGYVLPLALDRRALVAAAPASGPGSTVRSLQQDPEPVRFSAATVSPGDVGGWGAYVAGVVWSLRTAGHPVRDLDLVLDSDVPIGAGLSSSAAVECAVAVALADLTAAAPAAPTATPTAAPAGRPDRTELARLAQRAENRFVGAPTGVMDQMAALHGRAGTLVFLDTRTMAVEHVPLDLAARGLALLVVDTRAPHTLVDGQYAARRADCTAAAADLGVAALRDAVPADLDRIRDPRRRRRARHVVTENARVLDVVATLRAGIDPRAIGPVLTASHLSLREDFEVTVAHLDVAVDAALAAGAHGARMTGGGFGGCVIALVDAPDTGAVATAVAGAFSDRGFAAPQTFTAVPSPGAGRCR
ncbi:galactokinase [Pseudonocardia bannensis]|uniref:Galactokinase n=2 Tax=Pseudonocardia bannensis TaxID=630973 RepID=A0A848DD97_9PSEU|nr:galactokinase [Pseudonocardia bannensis]